MTDLNRVPVVPLDVAFELFPVFEDKTHQGLGLHLFLEIERFCMRTVVTCRGNGVIGQRLVSHQGRLTVAIGVALGNTLRDWGSHQLS